MILTCTSTWRAGTVTYLSHGFNKELISIENVYSVIGR